MIRDANFVLKQIMPYYDRYCAPYFQGIDHDVVMHGMPGGATSSSQEGAMKQGYIHLLPYMLRFLAGIRQIVKYHDVTPGSQITWNTAFLAVTGAWKRGGMEEVAKLLNILETVVNTKEEDLPKAMKKERLMIYQDCNDAFRNLLLGKFGKLPLGFPADWVYQSAFGDKWKHALQERTEDSPLDHLEPTDFAAEEKACEKILKRKPTDEELVMYMNHPGDSIKNIQFKQDFGDANALPLDVWFEGLEIGRELQFVDEDGKPHSVTIYHISPVSAKGTVEVRYAYDSQFMTHEVQVANPTGTASTDVLMADPNDKNQIGAPSNGDLWVTYVKVGDIVKKGQELFNISIMKQEKAVLSPRNGIVTKVYKMADYKVSRKMTPVHEGELIMEIDSMPLVCPNKACGKPVAYADASFCPYCGTKISASHKAKFISSEETNS